MNEKIIIYDEFNCDKLAKEAIETYQLYHFWDIIKTREENLFERVIERLV